MVVRLHNDEALFWMRSEERRNHEELIEKLLQQATATIKLVASTQALEESHWDCVLEAIAAARQNHHDAFMSLQITFPDLLPVSLFPQLRATLPDTLVLRGIQHPTPFLQSLSNKKLSTLNVGIQPMWDDATSLRTCQELENVDANLLLFTYFQFTAASFRAASRHPHLGFHHCKFTPSGTAAFLRHYHQKGEGPSSSAAPSAQLTIRGGLVFEHTTVSEVFRTVLGPRSTIAALHLDLQFGDTHLIEALTEALQHNHSIRTLTVHGANHFDNRAYLMQELQFVTRGFEIYKFLESIRHHSNVVEFESDVPAAAAIVEPFLVRNRHLRRWKHCPNEIPRSLWPSVLAATQQCAHHSDIVFRLLMSLDDCSDG